MQAQQEIGFVERFALAEDRREALQELIPGTEEFFYYHCLHHQNEGALAAAEAILVDWRAKRGDGPLVQKMWTRQVLLAYHDSPERALKFLRTELNLNHSHAAPSKDRAAEYPSTLDDSSLSENARLDALLASDASLAKLETSGLHLLMDRNLSDSQWRSVIGRLDRADLPRLVDRLAGELALRDSQGFGWAPVHSLLTLEQLQQLHQRRPELLENDNFVRVYATRLLPPEGTSLSDKSELRSYLNRLLAWTRTLPASQNSLKALALGNLLKLDLSERRFARDLFLEYLALPRAARYYNEQRRRANRAPQVNLGYSLKPAIPLPPVGPDEELVQHYLEHFFVADDDVGQFATYLDRAYLERVLAETKILNAVGDSQTWYAKLSPAEQQVLRDRVEVRFTPQNPLSLPADANVSLEVALKNVDELIVRVYAINTRAFFQTDPSKEIGTDIDLDGLVANAQRRFEYALPADRRHLEKIEFPELEGRGVWVIDLLGGGQRSRALVRKGDLLALQRLGDAGQVFQIVDESGQPVPQASIEFSGRAFAAQDGKITIPYAEQTITRNILLVDGEFARRATIIHHGEEYRLEGGFLVDRQALVAGTRAPIALHARLTCNGHPVSLSLLEESRLTLTMTDADGVSSSRTFSDLELRDGAELVQDFLVPPRLRQLELTLTGRVDNQSRRQRVPVSLSQTIDCNGIAATNQIGDFFLQSGAAGFRLHVLGRNGEPLSRLPVGIALKWRHFEQPRQFTLATDDQGVCHLGLLSEVESLTCHAGDLQQVHFKPHALQRNWPTRLNLNSQDTTRLPLGVKDASPSQFALYELRGNAHYRQLTEQLRQSPGMLEIAPLTSGDYELLDHETGQRVHLKVVDGEAVDQFLVGPHRVVQTGRRQQVIIRDIDLQERELVIKVAGADDATRIHLLASVFHSPSLMEELRVTDPNLSYWARPIVRNEYVDSLRLDEEYGYILNRQGLQKYPGNLLPQPTLLVHPWEVSTTENERQQARGGDAIPGAAMREEAEAPASPLARQRSDGALPDWKSFDFLSRAAELRSNLRVKDGEVRVPLGNLTGLGSIQILAVHPTSRDMRRIDLPVTAVPIRDQRLPKAFQADQHLAQRQRVEILSGEKSTSLGDPATRRLQVYTTLADVFQLYSTLVQDAEFEKFRFITRWPELTDAEQRAKYSEFACHELDLFLYTKDRKFFEAVVQPLLEQKLQKQLVDRWLLSRSIEEYRELWRVQRLNTLERILLATASESGQGGTKRWLSDYLVAHPLPTQIRDRLFRTALRGGALEAVLGKQLESVEAKLKQAISEGYLNEDIVALRAESADMAFGGGAVPTADADGLSDNANFFGVDRSLGRAAEARGLGLFRSLDKTREWADTQYYHVRLDDQLPELIPPNAFWLEFLDHGAQPFLPRNLELPTGGLTEALCALAVIDLPFKAAPPKLSVEDNQLVVTSATDCIVFLQSVESAEEQADDGGETILVGQDLYLARPNTAEIANQPVAPQQLLQGVPYRANVVVTNPTSVQRRLQVLTQLPAGSLPLQGAKTTNSTSLELKPYSTAQVEYQFYFPVAGEFDHYGAQISHQAEHVAGTASSVVRVLTEPEDLDRSTWSYVADWGTNEQVLEFLREANLQQLDLSRIAFRMQDAAFFADTVALLSESAQFTPALWAYAVKHRDLHAIEQLLQNRADLVGRLGPTFQSPLIHVDPDEQLSFEQLDYKPLVVARAHQLGPKRVILNPSLSAQYQRLLELLAYQAAIAPAQRMQLCYYLLLQNRLDEALQWFDQVQPEMLETRLQYDYFDAYLEFYRGDYARARRIADEYAAYPVPRWQRMFEQIRRQVSERETLLAGHAAENASELPVTGEQEQDLLVDAREAVTADQAQRAPALALNATADDLVVEYANLDRLQVNYYLMDIELLFSRNPFVSQGQGAAPVIQANFSQPVALTANSGRHRLELPPQLQNKNLVVEVNSAGISRSHVVTANALQARMVESFGRVRVLERNGGRPVEAAYVKVYARHQDGSVRFYKDGYTDLRGQFDYASLSTGDLSTVQRFAILILDEERGAIVQEAQPPAR